MSAFEVKALEEEIAALEQTLNLKKSLLYQLKAKNATVCPYSDNLTAEEVIRYSRQMIMPQVTKKGQLLLKKSKILIVGAGGLGCPAALYLASSGVGEIHVIDYDDVELSNLHRQILHLETDIGRSKVQSVTDKLKNINSNINIVPLHIHASDKISEIVTKHKYDAILDCSDNAPTRYLLNDISVFNNIPLVSGSALQMEGQLTVYHYGNGPCYRCLFPVPPPAQTVTNCGDGGVLGPVAGVIGTLQALEAIKIVVGLEGILAGRLLLFDGSSTIFRNVKLRNKVPDCCVCGENPKIVSPVDYEQFCGSRAHDKVVNIEILQNTDSVEVDELNKLIKENKIVVDVRPELEFEMCRLEKTFNVPFSVIKAEAGLNRLKAILGTLAEGQKDVFVLCRRGNDSQRTVAFFKEHFPDKSVRFFNIKGGLHAYANKVDSSFPVY